MRQPSMVMSNSHLYLHVNPLSWWSIAKTNICLPTYPSKALIYESQLPLVIYVYASFKLTMNHPQLLVIPTHLRITLSWLRYESSSANGVILTLAINISWLCCFHLPISTSHLSQSPNASCSHLSASPLNTRRLSRDPFRP